MALIRSVSGTTSVKCQMQERGIRKTILLYESVVPRMNININILFKIIMSKYSSLCLHMEVFFRYATIMLVI